MKGCDYVINYEYKKYVHTFYFEQLSDKVVVTYNVYHHVWFQDDDIRDGFEKTITKEFKTVKDAKKWINTTKHKFEYYTTYH